MKSETIFALLCVIAYACVMLLVYNMGVRNGKAQVIKKEPKIVEARVEAKGNINDLLSDMRIYHHN